MSFFKHLKNSKSFKTNVLSIFSFKKKKDKIGTKELVIVLSKLGLVISYFLGSWTENTWGRSWVGASYQINRKHITLRKSASFSHPNPDFVIH